VKIKKKFKTCGRLDTVSWKNQCSPIDVIMT